MALVGEQLLLTEVVCREFDLNEIWQFINHAQHKMYVWSWGTTKPTIVMDKKALRFRVQGRFHTGHVYIVLNGSDLFDVYYTSIHGMIKKISNDIYIDGLMQVLDRDIESGE